MRFSESELLFISKVDPPSTIMQIHEIAEGDEGSSEDGFEEDCNEDEGEEAIVQELAEELFEGREKLNSLRSSFKDDEHNMLFELEEDAGEEPVRMSSWIAMALSYVYR